MRINGRSCINLTLEMCTSSRRQVSINYLSIKEKAIVFRKDGHLPVFVVTKDTWELIGQGCLNINSYTVSNIVSNRRILCRKRTCTDHSASAEQNNQKKIKCFGVVKVPFKWYESCLDMVNRADQLTYQEERLTSKLPFLNCYRPNSRPHSANQSEVGFVVEPSKCFKSKFNKLGRCRKASETDVSSETESQVSQWSGFRESMIDTNSIESFSTLEKVLDLETSAVSTSSCANGGKADVCCKSKSKYLSKKCERQFSDCSFSIDFSTLEESRKLENDDLTDEILCIRDSLREFVNGFEEKGCEIVTQGLDKSICEEKESNKLMNASCQKFAVSSAVMEALPSLDYNPFESEDFVSWETKVLHCFKESDDVYEFIDSL